VFFLHLVDKIQKIILGWKEKTLSMGGKETLLKAITQAIPVFAMMVFQIPKSFCKGMKDAIANYWWGDDNDNKKIHWQAWWKLCVPKQKGGMGFRDFHVFNLAMLAKQCHHLMAEPDSFCAQVMRAKYYPDGNLLNATQKSGSSFT
jgi:hypothetical protein